MQRKRQLLATIALSLLGVIALVVILRLSHKPVATMQERQPGRDRPEGSGTVEEQSPVAKGKLIPGTGQPADVPGSWPWFRGPKLNAIYEGTEPLLREWPKEGPRVLWKVELGEGHAGPAIHKGRVYLMDYDQKAVGDALRCLSLADGKEIWRFFYPLKVKRNHGMSRTVVAVTDKYAVAIGPKCHVICVEAETGKLVWSLDLVKDFGTTVPEWYAGQCPLIDGDKLILAPGGECLVMAVELATGKVLWRSPNPRDWKMTHTSILPMEFAGQRFYVYSASDGVAGVSATDGRIVFDSDLWKVQIAACASPVVVGTDKIFFSGGYNSGCMMTQLKDNGGKITIEPVWRMKPTEFGAPQQTPILYRDHLYGVRPDGQFACVTLNGKVAWTSGAADKFNLGPYLLANGLFYVLADDGRMVLAEATHTAYRRLAQAQVLHGHDACAPMAMVAGRLLCRDLTVMVCLDVSGGRR